MAPTVKEMLRSLENGLLELTWEVGRQLRKDERIQITELKHGGPDRETRWVIKDAKFDPDSQPPRIVIDLAMEESGG